MVWIPCGDLPYPCRCKFYHRLVASEHMENGRQTHSIIELFSEYEKPLSKVVKDDKENSAGNQCNVAL